MTRREWFFRIHNYGKGILKMQKKCTTTTAQNYAV